MEPQFQANRSELKDELLDMCANVERNIADAIKALIERDFALLDEVPKRDPEVDKMEIEIDQRCHGLLVRFTPVGQDLRYIATALKIVKDLERIGDIAGDVSEHARAVLEDVPVPELYDLPTMAFKTLRMLKHALDSFVNQDKELARQVIEEDDAVDELHDQLFTQLIGIIAADPRKAGAAAHLFYILQFIERIGDHSCNIAEMVVFAVEGEDIRHYEKIKGLMDRE